MTNHAEMNDSELIRNFREKDKSAGDELVRRYYAKVHGWCLRRLLSPVDAADAAQEVFMRVLAEKRIFSFKEKASLASWLFIVTRNVCMAFYRTQKRRKENPMGEMAWDFPALPSSGWQTASPESGLEATDRYGLLRAALDDLPEKYRCLVEAYYLDEQSTMEVCLARRIKQKTFYVQLMRIRLMLRKQIVRKIRQSRFSLNLKLGRGLPQSENRPGLMGPSVSGFIFNK